MREVPVQSSISFYILSIPHAESITMQMPNLFLFLLSWSMHGKWMLWKLQERTGTLKCIYVPPSPHSSSPPPLPRLLLAPPALSTSSLQWFIPAECFFCCFVFSFPVCGCDDDLRATLLCTTQLKNFLCEENLHNNNAQENKKFWRLGTTGQKNTKSCADLCTLLNARHGRRAYNEDDDCLVSYSLDKENYGKQKMTVKVDSDYYSDRKGFLMSIPPFFGP